MQLAQESVLAEAARHQEAIDAALEQQPPVALSVADELAGISEQRQIAAVGGRALDRGNQLGVLGVAEVDDQSERHRLGELESARECIRAVVETGRGLDDALPRLLPHGERRVAVEDARNDGSSDAGLLRDVDQPNGLPRLHVGSGRAGRVRPGRALAVVSPSS